MSCGVYLCIECGRHAGLSWGDVSPSCACGGECVMGNNRRECEEEALMIKKIRESPPKKLRKISMSFEKTEYRTDKCSTIEEAIKDISLLADKGWEIKEIDGKECFGICKRCLCLLAEDDLYKIDEHGDVVCFECRRKI